jgi:hypothetical protein
VGVLSFRRYDSVVSLIHTEGSFSSDEVARLKWLLRTLSTFASENKSLTTKLRLKNKFVETIGEGMGLLFCQERFGNSVNYEWPGRRRRGFDVRLRTPEGRTARVQVKTNTDRVYDFKLFTLKVNKEAKDKLKKGDTQALFRQVESEVERKDTDFFLLIHWYNFDKPTYYILDKRRLVRAICKDYQKYFNRRDHRKDYNFGISRKTGMWWPHLNKKTVDSIGRFERDWSLVTRALALRS